MTKNIVSYLAINIFYYNLYNINVKFLKGTMVGMNSFRVKSFQKGINTKTSLTSSSFFFHYPHLIRSFLITTLSLYSTLLYSLNTKLY